ncbi:LacI family transcriptional regulator [Streptomyces sp. NBC_01016]|uniref:LacI family DNA-binding transcriptional regulator n=1 Tax=Streptomyces sp. NBC_01016 TaxID=2903720 RepID=UPI0022585B24|nr:LacI family DNA-binding transcriptional regulator [Streptomyces sp. NBC_01016]MCX4827504.1 LacI family transcriptional regulator [Streptomyces sp. NBC_01016]
MRIAHIAALAGVSVPTVSRVLNGRPGVSDGTRARIEELISEHGYRKTSDNRQKFVELIFRELKSMWVGEIIRGVEEVARRNRAGVIVSKFGLHDADASVDDTVGRRPLCVLSVFQLPEAERERLRAKGIPYVVFDPMDDVPDGVPYVGATNFKGGRSATRHLIALGHRHIALIGGPDHAFCLARAAGYRSAMEAAGLPVDPDATVRGPLTREGGQAAARALLGRPDRPTAIVTANDMQALGVYQAAREAGLRVPQDLSVVGFDDMPVAVWADPPLTTVRQPLDEMAASATELALALGRGERVRQLGVEIATELVVRESTAAPRS